MHTDEDCSWEEVYRSNGVRCDIDDETSSPGAEGICPVPRVNPFLSNLQLERWMEADRIPEDALA